MQSYSEAPYCNLDWFYTGYHCVRIPRISTHHIVHVDQLKTACSRLEGIMLSRNDYRYFDVVFAQYMPIFLKSETSIVILYEHGQEIFTLNTGYVGHSEYIYQPFTEHFRLPFIAPYDVSLRVICHQQPINITDKCMQGFSACKNGECIPEVYLCDNYPHCLDASDESNCTDPCTDPLQHRLYFKCNEATCIAISRVCDLIQDCENWEDEQECPDNDKYIASWETNLGNADAAGFSWKQLYMGDVTSRRDWMKGMLQGQDIRNPTPTQISHALADYKDSMIAFSNQDDATHFFQQTLKANKRLVKGHIIDDAPWLDDLKWEATDLLNKF